MIHDDVFSVLRARRVLPVLVLAQAESAPALGAALLRGGLPIVEVTFRTNAAEAAIRGLAADSRLCVGAGTVITVEQVERAVAAGARFIITPGLSPAVVGRCQQLQVPVIPGVATATEIIAALELGLDVVKLFPAQALGGVPMLSALAAPFPSVRFVPTGGIDADRAEAYLGHPAVLAVGGSWLVAPPLLAARDWPTITKLTATATGMARGKDRPDA